MVPGVMPLEIRRERLQHPGGQHDRLFRRVAAFAMQIQNGVAVPLGEMPPLRPRQFNTPGAGTDPEERHGIVAPAPLLSSRLGFCQVEGFNQTFDL